MPVVEPNPSAVTSAPAGDPAAAAPDVQSPPSASPQRPEGLPDHFWDDATGVRTPELIASFNELSAAQAKQAKAFENFPEDVAKAGEFYKLPEQMLPEGVKLPEGVTFQVNEELLAAALPILHKHRIDPAAFQELAQGFNAFELQRYVAANKEFAEDSKKLGAKGDVRRKAVADGLAALVGADKAAFIDTRNITSGAVEFFEAILSKFTTQSTALPGDQRRNDDPPPAPKSVQERWYGGSEQRAN